MKLFKAANILPYHVLSETSNEHVPEEGTFSFTSSFTIAMTGVFKNRGQLTDRRYRWWRMSQSRVVKVKNKDTCTNNKCAQCSF